jgi:peptide/nickel transport system substrate-binding protein
VTSDINRQGDFEPGESGITRRDVVRRGMVGGLAISGAAWLAACESGDDASGQGDKTAAKPRRGGTLTVAMVGGGSSDSIDPHFGVFGLIDQARTRNIYDTLVDAGRNGRPELRLAESMEPNADATVWTIRIREGVRFHNNKPVTADDVVASIKRATGPEAGSAIAWGAINRAGIKKRDARTVEVPFDQPNAILLENLAALGMASIVPADYDPKKPVGSGAFAYQSFTAGERSVFVRNEDYWDGTVYLDKLEILDMPDTDARVNALLSGQVHAVEGVPAGQLGQIEQGGSKILRGKGALALPFVMRCDVEPFRDVRVRQAMQLLVDRPQMIDSVLSGNGVVGNDLLGPFDTCGMGDIPQREHDVEKAKSLLAAAGQSDLRVKLTTAPIATGTVDMAQVLAQQAKEAGVTITVDQVDTSGFFENFLQWPFGVEYLSAWSFLAHATFLLVKDAPYHETHYNNAQFNRLYAEALRTPDTDARCDLVHEMQTIVHDDTGYIVWGFADYLDGYSSRVGGLEPTSDKPLGAFYFHKAFLT